MNEHYSHWRALPRLLAVLLGVAVATGCDTELPAPEAQADIDAGADVDPEVATLGLQEGDIFDKTVYSYRSVSAFDPPEVRTVPHQVVDGRLQPMEDESEPMISGMKVAYYEPEARGRPTPGSQEEAEALVEAAFDEDKHLPTGPRALEFLKSSPKEARSTSRTDVLVTKRISSVGYMADLTSRGVEFQFRQIDPPPIGATEVVELILPGGTRAAIEQFEDPELLTIWHKANIQMMKDLGMDPEQHMVLRGMTLVRLGKNGHEVALQRARAVPLVDEAAGFLPIDVGSDPVDSCSR